MYYSIVDTYIHTMYVGALCYAGTLWRCIIHPICFDMVCEYGVLVCGRITLWYNRVCTEIVCLCVGVSLGASLVEWMASHVQTPTHTHKSKSAPINHIKLSVLNAELYL